MRPISKKQAAINRRLKQAYVEIDSERPPVCEGCGLGGLPVSHSHAISQKRCKYLHKPELIYDKRNIYLECFGSPLNCHNRWENASTRDCSDMLNFEEKMQFLQVHDKQIYEKIINR